VTNLQGALVSLAFLLSKKDLGGNFARLEKVEQQQGQGILPGRDIAQLPGLPEGLAVGCRLQGKQGVQKVPLVSQV
jgi:hypothetical protein